MIKNTVEKKSCNMQCAIPFFALPNDQTELMLSIFLFLGVVLLIYVLGSVWIRLFVSVPEDVKKLKKILIWEFGTVLSIIGVFLFGQYCVILPLLFFLAFLVMWYLVRAIGR